jgi:hypothetical protein
MSLSQYLKSFSRIRTDKSLKRRSALTAHQTPHKPFQNGFSPQIKKYKGGS